jgi:hypothetical protein
MPHKTRQPGALSPEKKRDAPRFWQGASQLRRIQLEAAGAMKKIVSTS